MREQGRHRVAFERYAAMGPSRSLARLAAEMEVSESSVKAWSRAFGWATRLGERAKEVSKELEKRSVHDEVEATKRDKQLVRMALLQLAKQLAGEKIRGTMSDVERLIRLDRELDGRDVAPERMQHSPFMQALLIQMGKNGLGDGEPEDAP